MWVNRPFLWILSAITGLFLLIHRRNATVKTSFHPALPILFLTQPGSLLDSRFAIESFTRFFFLHGSSESRPKQSTIITKKFSKLHNICCLFDPRPKKRGPISWPPVFSATPFSTPHPTPVPRIESRNWSRWHSSPRTNRNRLEQSPTSGQIEVGFFHGNLRYPPPN